MKDPLDKSTGDLITKRGPGRPSTGQAKSKAEVQRDYRERQKAEGLKTVKLSKIDISALTLGLAMLVAKHQGLPTVAARYQELKDRLDGIA